MIKINKRALQAEDFFEYYMLEAVKSLSYIIDLKPSLGQRMLLRRYMQEALDDLKINQTPICSLDYYKLSDEALSRFFYFGYHIPFTHELSESVVGGMPITPQIKARINETFGEQI